MVCTSVHVSDPALELMPHMGKQAGWVIAQGLTSQFLVDPEGWIVKGANVEYN